MKAMRLVGCVALSFALFATSVLAHDDSSDQAEDAPYLITPIFQQAMSDPELEGYEMLVLRLDVVPGGVDQMPHRHDADLFVYVLSGTVEVELDGVKTVHTAGSMFHEPRNALHSLLRNTCDKEPAGILASFVIKSGREPVIPEVE